MCQVVRYPNIRAFLFPLAQTQNSSRTIEQDYVSKMSTHEIEALLPPQTFKRVHRSFIVSLDKIEAYTAEAVELSGGAQIPVGRGYREVLEGL